MKTHLTRRIPLAVAVCLALAALALGFPASASPGAPNPGHLWTELENHGTSGSPVDTYYLGTMGSEALELRVDNVRALRLEPDATSPNVIGGHSANSVTAGAYGATIGGGGASGYTSRVTDIYGTVGGGRHNQAGDDAGTTDDAPDATVGGGVHNTAGGGYATVAGGYGGSSSSPYATIGGGLNNTASGSRCTIGGGATNTVSGDYATVAGGMLNTAEGPWGSVGGGRENNATGDKATVGGGYYNTAEFYGATVAGGGSNTASGIVATVGGGGTNTASAESATVGGGNDNSASGTAATVPGGQLNTAQGDYSFAAGRRAKADHQGTFVWADSTDADFHSTANDQFSVRADGGALFTTAGGEAVHVQGNDAYLNYLGPDGASSLYFYEAGSPTGERLYWENGEHAFRVSDRLFVDDSALFLNYDGTGWSYLVFWSGGTAEDLHWNSFDDRFEFTDDLHVFGTLTAGTKSAVVDTSQGQRLTYTVESPEMWLEDFGTAQLLHGKGVVSLDPLFAETVNTGVDYHVFLTPLGDSAGLFVASKADASFEVRETGGGSADIAFDYRIVAKRRGYENERLEEFSGAVEEPEAAVGAEGLTSDNAGSASGPPGDTAGAASALDSSGGVPWLFIVLVMTAVVAVALGGLVVLHRRLAGARR